MFPVARCSFTPGLGSHAKRFSSLNRRCNLLHFSISSFFFCTNLKLFALSTLKCLYVRNISTFWCQKFKRRDSESTIFLKFCFWEPHSDYPNNLKIEQIKMIHMMIYEGEDGKCWNKHQISLVYFEYFAEWIVLVVINTLIGVNLVFIYQYESFHSSYLETYKMPRDLAHPT